MKVCYKILSVIKVMLKIKYIYPTRKLYLEAELLSVRRLFIYKIVPRVHKQMLNSTDYPEVIRKRIYRANVIQVKTKFAQKFPYFLHPFVYNKLHSICDFRENTCNEVKLKTYKILLNLSYEQTEEILKIVI